MSQNRSTAVMQRRTEPHDSLDFFPTPPWATRALCEWLGTYEDIKAMTALDPACGAGDMVRPLAEYFQTASGADVHDYGGGYPVADFLFGPPPAADWIITNPPFRLADQFIKQGLAGARHGVAVLVRTAFLEGIKRHAEIFSDSPPTDILQFCERVPMVKGRVDKDASSATAYCWCVWIKIAMRAAKVQPHRPNPPSFHWISSCRKALERPDDYTRECANREVEHV